MMLYLTIFQKPCWKKSEEDGEIEEPEDEFKKAVEEVEKVSIVN
jgi:hypothetical protein